MCVCVGGGGRNKLFRNFLSEIPIKSQTVWIKTSGLIRAQSVCKGNSKPILAGRGLVLLQSKVYGHASRIHEALLNEFEG